jgi:hypothetical protein
MADDASESPRFSLQQTFPWLALFRATNLAANLGKVAIGALGALALAAGWWLFGIPFANSADPERAAIVAQAQQPPWSDSDPTTGARYASALERWNRGSDQFSSAGLVFEPWARTMAPFVMLVQGKAPVAYSALVAIWTLLVSALVGGAICRMTALEFARDSMAGAGDGAKFALKHFRAYVLAPLLPVGGALVIVALSALGGLLMRVPAFDVVASALWFLALVGGALLAIALLGLAAIWPLMFPAISAEATEGIDALTHSFHFLVGRPWHFLWCWAVALLNGAIAMIVAVAIGFATLKLSQYAVSWGGGEENLRQLYAYSPEAGGWRHSLAGDAAPAGTTKVAAVLVGFWTHVVFLAVVGFAHSYFWTAATLVYFVLRKEVDDLDFSVIEEDEVEDDPFPTAGGAGSFQPAAFGAGPPLLDIQPLGRPNGGAAPGPSFGEAPGAPAGGETEPPKER